MVADLPIPDRVDVAVLGGGLAGLTLAERLSGSAEVLVVTGEPPPGAASPRSLGIVACGGADSPARLVQGLGEERAKALWTWSRRATSELALLAERLGVSWSACGSVRLALDPLEAEELSRTETLIRSWEGEGASRRLAPEEIQDLGCRNFAGGIRVEGDGRIDLPALLAALVESLQDRVTLVGGKAGVHGSEEGGIRISIGNRNLLAEIVVVAGGPASSRIHPWFDELLYPVRIQGLRTSPVAHHGLQGPALARHRFEAWQQEDDGRIAFVGCRWAEQPEMGAGDWDDSVTSEAVQQRQQAFHSEHLGLEAPVQVAESWSGIAGFSCDGLPLVGPIPGNPRILAMTGWCGWGLSAIGAAAQDLAAAILGKEGEPAPRELLSPRRML